ncbi:MAG: class I SAM-dependent methyltransferase [Phycisphaerales bacterium]|nr:class I SAM-dependent methyltransferase [Phycisphaerales bacterium]
MSKRKEKKKKSGQKDGWRTAKTSDRHELYELSVQNVEGEIDFVEKVWEELRDRSPVRVREDFCGTFAAACEWIRRGDEHTAVGVDLSREVLDWGRERNLPSLSEDEVDRLEILEEDVLTTRATGVDSVLAMNFSYFLFKTRDELRAYFASVREALVDDGILLCDCYGGGDSFLEMEEERHLDGFTYVWDQNQYDPITGDVVNHIHFRFPDGSSLEKAFTYEWRLWTIPEIRELLEEAGFGRITVWWEGDDEEGEGDGEFEPATRGEACPGWIAYITAEK